MSLIQEYLKMGFRGLKKIDKVTEGYYNALLLEIGKLPESQKKVAEQRLKTCTECVFMTRNAQEAGIYKTEIKEDRCSICWCFTKKKALSFSDSCPLPEIGITLDENNTPKAVWLLDEAYNKAELVSEDAEYIAELYKHATATTFKQFMGVQYVTLGIPRKFFPVTFTTPTGSHPLQITSVSVKDND